MTDAPESSAEPVLTLSSTPAAIEAPWTSDVSTNAPEINAGAAIDEEPRSEIDATHASLPESFEALYRRGDYGSAAVAAQRSIERGEATDRAWTVLVRSLANEGKLAAAGEAAAAALDNHGMSAEMTYLSGMLLAQAGRHGDAAATFKRALYLDPNLAIAHLALGDALTSIGDDSAARRAYVNAELLLKTMGAEDAVAGADDLPAGRLLQIARYHRQRLPSVAT